MSSSHRHRSHAHRVITNAPTTGKSQRVKPSASSRLSRLRAASAVTGAHPTLVTKPAKTGHTRRERLMIVALVAIVLGDVLR
ncbi:MAG TPA: hypothetical protein VGP84_10285, partial [Gemmatimonadaceae bacterium]|nr:hypothetical protein [Gemmatimonadaceae bacterium]